MDDEFSCPHCGHSLTTWEPPSLTASERWAMWVADQVASWWFSATLLLLISVWVVLNVVGQPYEPYPVIVFAVLSAVLASVAALQGPLILTAQRRSAARDRLRDVETLRAVTHNEDGLDRLEEKLDALVADLRRNLGD